MQLEDISENPASHKPEEEQLSAVPLLKGAASPKSTPGYRQGSSCCCAPATKKKKNRIIFIGALTLVFIFLVVVAIFLLLTAYSSSIGLPRNMKSLNETSCESVDHANESLENPLEAFAGDWKLDHQENFDEFLYTIGVNFFIRKVAPMFSTEVSVIVHGPAEVTMAFKGLISISRRFPFNVEFEEKTPDGRTVKSIHTMEGNTWTQVERWDVGDTEKSAKYVSKIINGEFVLTIYADDVICTRTYVRIAKR